MKNKVDKIVVLLFIVTMCFLMTISAHAETENSYFLTSASLPSNIELNGVTLTPSNTSNNPEMFKEDPHKIFNEDVSYCVRVREGEYKTKATNFSIETQSKGVLLVYYIRSYDNGTPIANDGGDLNIVGLDGVVEYYEMGLPNSTCTAVKYFVLDAGTYTMTATEKTCCVYGFVYMPGNVAAYDTKGRGDFSLIGQYSEDSYDNLPVLRDDSCYFHGWYKDASYTEKVTGGEINEPTILYAKWVRCVWDFFQKFGACVIKNEPKTYDGLIINNSTAFYPNVKTNIGLVINDVGTKEYNSVVFTPEYDGDLIASFVSSSTTDNRIFVIGTDVIGGTDIKVLRENTCVAACEFTDTENYKTINAKLKAGTTYYLYGANGGITIKKIKYVAGAASPVVDGDKVTLTTTANMQGWRAFYDAKNSYTVDGNTSVYMVVGAEGNDEVKLCNRTGKKVPKGSPVILHTDAEQEDGTYLITMTKDDTPYVYDGNDNMLCASEAGSSVNAYRLGFRVGEGNGVAFYPWSVDSPSAGIVYLELSGSNAKIAFDTDDMTGIVSVRNDGEEGRKIFNLKGQRLAAPQKGFNIINGKKILVL